MSKKNTQKRKQSTQIPAVIKKTVWLSSLFSKSLTTKLAVYLFSKPIRHVRPKRENRLYHLASQRRIYIPEINKEIQVYRWGDSKQKALLVHGWSGRGTQLHKITDLLLKLGYEVWSFDAPAHGQSEGSTTMMVEFISCILEITRKIGAFDVAVGHSLGGMSLLNAAARGFDVKKLAVIGSGDVIQDIIDPFVAALGLDISYGQRMKAHYESKLGQPMASYDANKVAGQIAFPVLVIHDSNDLEIPVQCAQNITSSLPNGSCIITDGLGHRKILGDPGVLLNLRDWFSS